LPERKTEDAAGYDLYTPQDTVIKHGRTLIPLGFAMEMPAGWMATIRPRSGFTLRGMTDKGYWADECIGTIDYGYRGNIGAIVINHGEEFLLPKGTRIAQMIFQRYEAPEIIEVEHLDETERGNGGFGSTGIRQERMKHEKEIRNYELSVNKLAEIFLNKQFGEEGEPPITLDGDHYWVGDDAGGALCACGTHYYNFNDVLTDLKEDAPIGELDRYNEWAVRCTELGIEPRCNYHSWLHGAPRISDDMLTLLEDMKERFKKAIDECNGTDF